MTGDLFLELALDFNLGEKVGEDMGLRESGFFPDLTGYAGLPKDFLH